MTKVLSIFLAVDGEFDEQAMSAEFSALAKAAGANITLMGMFERTQSVLNNGPANVIVR